MLGDVSCSLLVGFLKMGYRRSKHVRVLQKVALTSVNTLMQLLFIIIQGACLMDEPV
jgi:hypothetical protein